MLRIAFIIITLLCMPLVVHARPVVLELYTSQGCPSCPPADAFVGKLKQHENLLPLSFHVDYWDKAGRKDPFGDRQYTLRQVAYHYQQVYTPQMVIDGQYETVGSAVTHVLKHVRRASESAYNVPMQVERSQEGLILTVGKQDASWGQPLDIWLFGYNHLEKNLGGRTGTQPFEGHNVVRYMEHLGQWQNGKVTAFLDTNNIPRTDMLAIVIQQTNADGKLGPVMGATTHTLKGS